MGRGADGSASAGNSDRPSVAATPAAGGGVSTAAAAAGSAASLLSEPLFQPFLAPEFECAEFASAALARTGSTAVEQTGALEGGIRLLGDQIREEVNGRYDELLAHSCRLRDSEASLQGVRLSVESLRSAMTRVTEEIMEPYTALRTKTCQLSNLHETADLLRHISQRLKLTGKLRQLLAAKASGGSLDLAKAAKFITDAKAVGEEIDLTGLEVLAADTDFMASAEKQVASEAHAVLSKGMSSLSQAEVGSALQVYYNLNLLPRAVDDLLSQYNLALSKSLGAALDGKKITAAVRASAASGVGASGTGSPSPANPGGSALADEMWNRISQFCGELHGSAVAVWHLQRVLAKKRDPLTHECFEDLVVQEGGPTLIERFWNDLTALLKTRLSEAAGLSRTSTAGRDFVREGLAQSFPRLASQLESTVAKLLRDTDIKGTFPAITPQEREALLNATAPFQDAYLSNATRRLTEAVTSTFPGGTSRPVPSAADVQKLVGRLYDELKSASASESLSLALGQRVGEALSLLAERAAFMAATGPELRQLGGTAGVPQARNIALCSALQEVYRAAAGLMARLAAPVAESLREPLEAVRGAAVESVAPIFRAAVEAAERCILSIHNEEFGQESQAYETATSPFLEELSQLLVYFRSEFLSRFHPPPPASSSQQQQQQTFVSALVDRMAARILVFFVRHASMLRPISQAGALRLTKDMAELEAAVGTNLVAMEHLGVPYKMLRALRPLLFQDISTLEASPLLKELPATVVLQHLYTRAPAALQSPMEQGGLTHAQWSLWMDQHPTSDAIARIGAAIKGSRAAAEPADEGGVIPLMLRICEAQKQLHS